MRGSVKRGAGSWSYVIDIGLDPDSGRRRQQRRRGFKTKTLAESTMREALLDLERAGSSPRLGEMRLGAYLEEWFKTAEPRLRETTAGGYRIAVDRIAARLGGLRLRELTPLAVERFYADLATNGGRAGRGLAPKTIRNTHIVLRKALADAERLELVDRNAAARAKGPSVTRPPVETWTAAELGRFLASVDGDRHQALWVLLATTGLRRGEVLGLRWGDLNLSRGTLSVSQSVTTVNNRLVVAPPKSDRSRRRLVLDETTLRHVAQHSERQRQERALLGLGNAGTKDFIFAEPTGEPIHPDSVTRRFKTLVRSSGLPELKGPHALRHTWASIALATGIHPKVVSDRLGHSTISITIDTYSHVIPGLDADAAATVAAQLFAVVPPAPDSE